MMKITSFRSTALSALLVAAAAGTVPYASAEITLLQQDPQANDPLSRLNFTVGGSIRPQFNNETGSGDRGSYKRNGFDGGTRFRFASDYYLFDDISWINFYELGVNIPAVFNWDNHYADGSTKTTRRKLYTGLKSQRWGQLTFGQQNSIYYDVVGAKTDVWDFDMRGQASGNGVNGDYDGSYRSRKMIKYVNSFGPVDGYVAWLLPDDDYRIGNGLFYKRQGGGSFGVDYHITPQLSWGAAWNITRAQLSDRSNGDETRYNQNILGSALSWKPDHWTLSIGGGWYNNFLTTTTTTTDGYLAGDAWGVEYFAGYAFPINNYQLKTIQPYVMGDRLEYVTGRNYQRIDNGLGISFQLQHGIRVDYEHVFTSATDHPGDMNLVRFWYDF